MIKRVPTNVVLIICLCAPFLATAQDRSTDRVNTERSAQVAANVARAIKAKEPKWSLKYSHSASLATEQIWKSGNKQISLRIYVCDSPEQASKWLPTLGGFQISGSEKLEDFGDEARFISIRYFSWVGVRKGRMLAVVQGPGGGFPLTKRFGQYALEQLEDQ